MLISIVIWSVTLCLLTAALTLSFKWQSIGGRIVMIMLCASLMILSLVFLSVLISQSTPSGRPYVRLVRWILWVLNYVYPLLIGVLLLLLAILNNESTVSAGPRIAAVLDPRQWDLNLTNPELLAATRRREWAFLFDNVVPLLPCILAATFYSTFNEDRGSLLEIVFIFVVQFCGFLWFVYMLFKDSLGGQSFGKYLTGTRIVNLADGRPIGTGKSVIRNLFFLIPFFAILELAVVSIRQDRLRLVDKITDSRVVLEPPNYINGEMVRPPGRLLSQQPTETVDPFGD